MIRPAAGIVGIITLTCCLAMACAEGGGSHTSPGTSRKQKTRPKTSLKGEAIVSYNVENLFDTKDDPTTQDEDFLPNGKLHWDQDRYHHKLDRLAHALTWSAGGPPALIGLAEVENAAVVNDLAVTAPLDAGTYTVVHFDSPDERGIDVALLVRKDFASVETQRPLPVDLGRDRTRDVLYAKLELASGEVLHVMMNHWPSRGEGVERSAPKRMAAARVVRKQVDAILRDQPQAKILVMGDFNDTPTDASIQMGLKASCDTTARADLFDLMGINPPADTGSFQYGGNWDYLDQIIVSRALLRGPGGIAGQASAFHDPRLLFRHPKYGLSPEKTYSGGHYKGGYSDHLPVVVQLR